MHRDFSDFIEILNNNDVEFVIIGGIALAFYGFPRFTGDLDIWMRPLNENAIKLFTAIEFFFGTPLTSSPDDFLGGYNMISLGKEPLKIEIHHTIDGVGSDEVWDTRVKGRFGASDVYYISKDTLIKNKRTVGRDQDLVDIKKLMSI